MSTVRTVTFSTYARYDHCDVCIEQRDREPIEFELHGIAEVLRHTQTIITVLNAVGKHLGIQIQTGNSPSHDRQVFHVLQQEVQPATGLRVGDIINYYNEEQTVVLYRRSNTGVPTTLFWGKGDDRKLHWPYGIDALIASLHFAGTTVIRRNDCDDTHTRFEVTSTDVIQEK